MTPEFSALLSPILDQIAAMLAERVCAAMPQAAGGGVAPRLLTVDQAATYLGRSKEPGTTKNNEARNLPLTAELYETLAMQRSIRDTKFPACPWVFFNEAGRKIGRFQRSWKTACAAAGLAAAEGEPDRLFHDLRRSGVRNLIRAGVPESVAMRISGHKTRSVFERYNIVSERDLHDAAQTGNLRVWESQSYPSWAHFGHT